MITWEIIIALMICVVTTIYLIVGLPWWSVGIGAMICILGIPLINWVVDRKKSLEGEG